MSTPEQTTKTAKIGMIGLAVMGENLAMNIERNGFPIAVFNRDPAKVDNFVARTAGKREIPTKNLLDRKSTRLNSSHLVISYAVFCLKKKNVQGGQHDRNRRASWRDRSRRS